MVTVSVRLVYSECCRCLPTTMAGQKGSEKGGSPGLGFTGGDSCSEGLGFESQYCILDGHFSHTFVVKIVMFARKDENKCKRDQVWSIVFKRLSKTVKFPKLRKQL